MSRRPRHKAKGKAPVVLGPACGLCGLRPKEYMELDGGYYCYSLEPVWGGNCWEHMVTADWPELREWLCMGFEEE